LIWFESNGNLEIPFSASPCIKFAKVLKNVPAIFPALTIETKGKDQFFCVREEIEIITFSVTEIEGG
jgi:hypothetical protein